MRILKQVMSSRLAVPMWTLLSLVVTASSAHAQSMRDYTGLPAFSANVQSTRSIMLTMSTDHQLFIKAYNDFSDLPPYDGKPETTFEVGREYVGYFDHTLCYTHDGAKFNPVARWNSGRICSPGEWSGNFLNWATMTRIDLVRQVLYGGYRYVPTGQQELPAETVLERSYLPQDAHSFAKYVPFNNLAGLAVVPTSGSRCADGVNTGSCAGYTFCNTTRVSVGPKNTNGPFSQDITEPPLLRVVKGNYMLWDSSERYQCLTTSADYQGRNYSANMATEAASEAKTAFDSGIEFTNANIAFDPSGSNLNNSANSGIQAFPRPPLYGDVRNYIVRVSVCDENYKPIDTDPGEGISLSYECKEYGSNLKPVGLLQRYGADPDKYDVRFGLLTGSYKSNIEYGLLRKNVTDFSEEVDTDGTFRNISNSIVRNLDALRIVDYKYADEHQEYRGTYRSESARSGGGGAAVACNWGSNTFNNGQCRNWGNPFSELLTESYRYLAGAENPSIVVSNESDLLPGLSIAEWSLPTDSVQQELDEFSCSSKSVLGVNASAVSYDWSTNFAGKQPGGSTGLAIPNADTTRTLAQLTDAIGISGNYFIGLNGGSVRDEERGQCSAKLVTDPITSTVTSLGQVRGTCPETPRLDGGYLGAGLAKYIFDEYQINTYGVSLTDALPRIKIHLDNNFEDGPTVVIVPACRNRGTNGDSYLGNCALVALKVIEDPVPASKLPNGVLSAGSYFVSWEDTEQGGDYDVDAAGIIRYERRASEIVVETKLLYNGTPDVLEFGYVISGTTTDGIKFPAWTPGVWDNLSVLADKFDPTWTPTNSWCVNTPLINCTKSPDGTSQQVTFAVNAAGSDVKFLPSPLELAAKYGSEIGPEDKGHVTVSNPGTLKSQLDGILGIAANQPSPGTGASVATNALAGEGLVLSSLYAPEYVDEETEEKITWAGHLNGLFYKENYFWEDCNQAEGALAGVITDGDCVIRIYLDEQSEQTVFDRYRVTRDLQGRITERTLIEPGRRPYNELKPLWSAAAELSEVTDPLQQRAYTTVDNSKRYIFTAVAKDNVPHVTGTDVIPFVDGNFAATTPNGTGLGGRNYRLLDAGDAAAAQEVVNYIRGQEGITGARNRTIDGKPWLLGDIMHSTAALVARPSALYDVDRIGDQTYSAFSKRYANRRLVTYVGGNDGMLHAFNGGFFNYNNDAPGYLLQPVGSTYNEYALGAELWAYVPYNLLPHLRWLKEPNYSHVYYVDSKVHTFDVNIFNGVGYSEEDYPGGWGTILVVGMRLGGGEYPVDSDGNGTDDRTLRSAYIIMDVTNPEKPPRLLAEITDEDLGFTVGDVDILSFRKPNATTGSYANPARNQWYLVLGSGPIGTGALQDATSDQDAQLFYVDLKRLTNPAEVNTWLGSESTEIAKSYVGGVTAMDWDSDFSTDMLYVGVVGTGTGADDPKGALMHAPVSYNGTALTIGTPTRLITGPDANRPVSRAPMVVRELGANNSYWVYAATGKLLVSDHLRPSNIDENWIYGVRVNNKAANAAPPWLTTASVAHSELKDVTEVGVSTAVDQGVRTFTVDDELLEDVTTPEQMEKYIRDTPDVYGWTRELIHDPELVFTAPAFAGTTFTVSSFSPSISDCKPSGTSRQYWLNLFTGLPQTDTQNVFLMDQSGVSMAAKDSDREGDLSADMGAQKGVLLGSTKAGENVITVSGDGDFKSDPAGQDPPAPTRRAWREIPMDELN
jgi:type IV pilus assembly protein PilY1